jgi:hypothetical protein
MYSLLFKFSKAFPTFVTQAAFSTRFILLDFMALAKSTALQTNSIAYDILLCAIDSRWLPYEEI